MLVIADARPLNYLVWVESVEILPQLYGQVVIPPEVRAELLANDAPAQVRSWADDLPSWVEVCGRIRSCVTIVAGGFLISEREQRWRWLPRGSPRFS